MEETRAIGRRIIDLGNRLTTAGNCGEKNAIASELATLVKYDLGGVVFMSDEVNDIVAHGGLLPGSAAVISSAVSTEYISRYQIPLLSEDDLKMYVQTVVEAIRILHTRLPEANEQLRKRTINNVQLDAMNRSSLLAAS